MLAGTDICPHANDLMEEGIQGLSQTLGVASNAHPYNDPKAL